MSFDLALREAEESADRYAPVTSMPAETFTGFFGGSGKIFMREFGAKTSQTLTMGAAGAARILEWSRILENFPESWGLSPLSEESKLSTRIFKFHDEVIQPAVDYWTPKTGEVGMAAEVFGGLVGGLAQLLVSPTMLVGNSVIPIAVDLVKKGVSPEKAVQVGITQGLGLAAGVWMPILGQNLWQRVLLGGVGFNVLQGIGMRGVAAEILKDTKAAEEFKPAGFAPILLDVLLGAAFGTYAHLSGRQRVQGAKMWEEISAWARGIDPSDMDALRALRVAQHANLDSMPGKPLTTQDAELHVQRLKLAVDQLATGKTLDVSPVGEPRYEEPAGRIAEMAERARILVDAAEEVRVSEGVPRIDPDKMAVVEAATTEGPPAPARGVLTPPRVTGEAPARPEVRVDPIVLEAERALQARPDQTITVGRDSENNPVTVKAKDLMRQASDALNQAERDVPLFEAAARCLLGGA